MKVIIDNIKLKICTRYTSIYSIFCARKELTYFKGYQVIIKKYSRNILKHIKNMQTIIALAKSELTVLTVLAIRMSYVELYVSSNLFCKYLAKTACLAYLINTKREAKSFEVIYFRRRVKCQKHS